MQLLQTVKPEDDALALTHARGTSLIFIHNTVHLVGALN